MSMSLFSASDDNKNDENPPIHSGTSKSVSSNDDEASFNNISTSYQRQSFQTKTEYQYISRNPIPNITIYPTNIHFTTTYPNKSLQSKIIISNGGSQAEDFNITLKGDPEFSVSTQKVSLSPGETQSLIINFNPKKVSLFNSSLIFEGRTSIVAPITGHCIPSPLEYPTSNSPSWIFPKKKTDRLIQFSNNSLSQPLSVVISTNCAAFKVSPQNFDIPPSSSCDINISFDPQQRLVEDPSISIQCPQSGDSSQISLIIAPNKEKIVIDFGAISVGRTTKQTLKLKYPQTAPIVQWPFSLENISEKGMPQDTMIFSFTAREIGDFRSKLHLSNFEIELRASSVDPPYRIKIPSHFPLRPFKVQNISESMLNLAFSLNTSSFIIDPETSDLRPNQISELSIKSTNSNISFPDHIVMKVIWSTNDEKRVVDEYQLPVNLNQSLSIVDMESSENGIYSSSQRRKSSSKCRTEVNPNEIELNTNYSNYNSETIGSANYNVKQSNNFKRRSSINSQNSSVNNKRKNNNNFDKFSESISQTKNADYIEQDDFDYNSSPYKFDNFEENYQSNQNQYSNERRMQSNFQQNRNHYEELDSIDYYEEDEEIDQQQNELVSNSKKINRSYDTNNKYSISLESYEDHRQNNNFNDYYDYDDNNEYQNSDYDFEMNNRTKRKQTRTQQKQNNSNKTSKSSQNMQHSINHHRHHHHYRHHRINSNSNRRIENEHKNRQKKQPRRSKEIDEYNYEYDYYENDYTNTNNSRKNKQKNRKINQEKYYDDYTNSHYESNANKNNKYEIEIEEEEEDISYSIEREKTQNSKKKIKNQFKHLESDYSSENNNEANDVGDTKKTQLNSEKNNNSNSFSRIEDLKTQMTQTNTIGNGLQNLGSQTLDSFDEELESHSANASKIQSSKTRNSTSTIATSTITTDNEESINPNRSDLETQTYIQKKTIKNLNSNSKSVSFASELAQLSHQQSSRIINPTTSSFSLVPFFGVSARHPSRFELTINSDYEIEIEAPQWIQLPRSIQPNQKFAMTVNSLPAETVSSTFSVHSESGDLSLPIIAYRGFSNLVFDSEVEMIEITDNQFTAAMVVKNSGERAGFIAFMLSESVDNVSLRVSPPVAIIQPKANLQVKFLVTTKRSEFTVPVVAYYGDEIVRQLQSVVAPNEYLSTAFNEIEFSNEISAFEASLNDCKPRDVLKIFRKTSQSSKLVFKSPQKSFGLNRMTISPSSIEFTKVNQEGKVSLLNLSPDPLSFSVTASSDCVTFSPRMGAAPPYGEAVITASLSSLIESQIIIHVGKEKFKIPLKTQNASGSRNQKTEVPNTNSIFDNYSFNESSSLQRKEKRKLKVASKNTNQNAYRKNSGVFSVVENKVEFDFVTIGDSKTIQFIIVNNEMYDMDLFLMSDNPCFICDKKIVLPGDSETAVDITFKPKSIGVYEGNFFIQNDDHKIQVLLSGECAGDGSSASSFITHPLEFPPCIPETIRRAQLRVSNKTDRFVSVTARTSAPFHCPFPFFEVDPFSYVLVPVRFIPKKAGEYNGTIEFHSSNGTVSTIELNGVCVDF